MRTCKLVVKDTVNVKFEGIDPVVRRKMCEALRFVVPHARHTPQYKLGRWDGTISFCTVGGGTYLNLLDHVLPVIMDAGYEIEIDDRRPTFDFEFTEVSETMLSHKVWPIGHTLMGEPIVLRDYQVEAIQRFTSELQSVQQIATAAGKTVVTAALSSMVEPYGRSVVIVPSKNLVIQTEEDYKNLGLDVGVYFGDRKELGHTHSIVTWQSLVVLSKKNEIARFLQGVVCVICDECHMAKAKLMKELLTGPFAHVPIRWGLTGTIPKADHESYCLLAGIGPVVGELRAVELQQKNVLANCQIDIIQLVDDHVAFVDYDSEHDFLVTDRTRLHYIANLVQQWAASGNTLILVDRIETGTTLHEMLPDSVFISGDTKIKKRQLEYQAIQTENHKMIIATYGVAAVGINVPRLFNLVLLEAGQSFIKVLQSIGRILRRTKDKDFAKIYDVCSSLFYSRRHLSKRREYYKEAVYPFTKSKVHYR